MDPTLLPAPLARCRELTVRSPNHLHHAAEKFEESSRYDFFLSAYASMRTLDDLVAFASEIVQENLAQFGAVHDSVLLDGYGPAKPDR